MRRYDVIIPFVALIWAGSFIAVKIGVKELSPVQIAFLRFAVASPFMLIALLLKKKKVRMPLREFPALIVLALTGVTLLYLFQFTGIKYTTASSSAVLINTNVIFIAILSSLFLREKISLMKGGGIMLGFLGVALIMGGAPFQGISMKGNLMIILSAICWAVYSVVGKKLLEKYDALTITTYVFIIGTLMFIPFMKEGIPAGISLTGWAVILYLALLCSVFAYIAWYDALADAEASKVAIFLNLIPLFAMLLSYIILKEKMGMSLLAGAFLIITGIYLTQKG